MNIKELIFIRNLCDKLHELNTNLINLSCLEDEEVPESIQIAMFSTSQQCDLIIEILSTWKKSMDFKYREVWYSAYPDMPKIEE